MSGGELTMPMINNLIWIAGTLSGGYYKKDGICIMSGAATIGLSIQTELTE